MEHINKRNEIDKKSNRKRSIRVFISSTFLDMVEERNILMTHCWPELRLFCAERHVELVEVDLRWGISEEQTRRNESLWICLNEIDACRPYFISLLGERYGWIPEKEVFSAYIENKQPWLKEHHDKSITELEIRHGVLNNPVEATNAFFFFRNADSTKHKEADFLSEDPHNKIKLAELKELIKNTSEVYPIHLFENYGDPTDLADIVLEKMKEAIEQQYPYNEIPNQIERETNNQDSFAELHQFRFFERAEYFRIIDRYCSIESKPLILHGESGLGKTFLLANWVHHWKGNHENDLIFQQYIGSTPDSSDHLKLLYRLIVFIQKSIDDAEDLPHNNDEMIRDIPIWLSKAREYANQHNIRFIIILDAINQLNNQGFISLLSWFPLYPFSGNLKLVISTLPDFIPEGLKKFGCELLKIQPLSSDECKLMATIYLKYYGKTLSDNQLNYLSSLPASRTPLFLRIFLDELRHTETYDQLEQKIKYYSSAKDIETLFHKVISRYENDYEQDRPNLVRETLEYIWAARRGLSEVELLQILGSGSYSNLPMAIWAPFRAALEDILCNHSGLLGFSHNYFKDAVENSYITNSENSNKIRLHLIKYFEKLPVSDRKCDEIPWLLRKIGAKEKLRLFLLDIDNFIHIYKSNKDEILQYWVEIDNISTIAISYTKSFDIWKNRVKQLNENISYTANQLALFLYTLAQYDYAEMIMREALSISEIVHGKDHTTTAIRLNNLAVFLTIQDKKIEAELVINRAIKIDEEFYGENDIVVARDLNNLSGLLQKSGRLNEAIVIQKRALEISENKYGLYHTDVAIKLNNIADLLSKSYRFFEAEKIARRSLEINEMNYGENHHLVAISLNILTNILIKLNKVFELEDIIKRALKIDEKYYWENHPRIISDLNSLAAIYFKTSKFSEALTQYEQILDKEVEFYGLDHPKLCDSLNNIAAVKEEIRDFEGAKLMFNRVLRINQTHFGIGSIEYVECLLSLSKLHIITKQLKKAESILKNAIHLIEENFGQNEPELAKCLSLLAQVYHDSDRMNEAEALMKKTISIIINSYGSEHPHLAIEMNNLSQLYKDSGRYEEAEDLIRKALNIDEKVFGIEHPNVAKHLNNLGMLLMDTGRYLESETKFNQAFKTFERCYGIMNLKTAEILNNLGLLKQNMNQLNEAESLMRQALSIDQDIMNNDASISRDLNNLGTLLKDMNRYEEAELLMNNALEIDSNIYGHDNIIIATRLNNLATLYYCTNRIIEAKPLLRKALKIIYSFSCKNGVTHPHLIDSINNYSALLRTLKWSESQIRIELKQLIPKCINN